MPFSSGTYTVAINFTTEAGSPPIEIAKLDQQMQDIATALSLCMLRDGTGTPTAAIPFGSQDLSAINSITIATASNDAVCLNLTKAGSKISLARSSDGASSFFIQSAGVGSGDFQLLNNGGTKSYLKLTATSFVAGTGSTDRAVCDANGTWTVSGTTAGTTPTMTFGSNIAITAGGSHSAGIAFTTATRFGIFTGSGAPTISCAKGSLYLRSDGASNVTRAYINTDGAGTWTAINTVA